MKTRTSFLGLLFLLTLGLFSSCTKLDRPAELSIDAQTLEFDITVLNRKFNIVNMGDELLVIDAYTDRQWVTVVGGNVSLSHAQTATVSVQIHPEFFQEYDVYTGNLFLKSNGGNFAVPIKVYYSQSAGPLLALDVDYIKISANISQDYFTIYNDGTENMNFTLQTLAPWVQFSQKSGTIVRGNEQRINVNVNRTGLAANMYSTEINVTSNGGNAVVNLDMDVNMYSITFFNPVYTPIKMTSAGFDPVWIEAGDRHSYLFSDNPSSFTYSATTKGETDDGGALGVEILWNEVINVSNYVSPTFNLNISADYFFMAVKNTGNYNLNMWSINYGNSYQIDDDFYIPNDGVEYGVAYYDAFEDTDIYARLVGTSDDVKWSQGVEFIFPWTENQYILLENNFKKSAVVRTGLKASPSTQLKVKSFNKPVPKSKGSIDLYNNK